jgi:FKBP-type peptidyl-prolyl cis-trans isomerase FklB
MMKKIIVLVVALSVHGILTAQTKKKSNSATSDAPLLKTSSDSISYAIGLTVARYCKEQGIESVNPSLISKALDDELKYGKTQLSEQQANGLVVAYVQKMRAEKIAVNKKAGEAFLSQNMSKPGVVALPSGLQYQILKAGDGPKPVATDKIKCNYEGRLLDGTVFDASAQHGGPIDISVGGVIAGWTEALQLMPVGSKWRLFIPSNLAYGDQTAQGSPIKPGSTLIFDVELIEIEK